MDESQSPSQEYRQQLAQNLAELRKSNDRDTAKDLLEQERGTHIYQLSRALKLGEPKITRFNKREFDENIIEASQSHNTVSNEASLYETFPYIKDIQGAGLGVGLDQMLEIVINSQLNEAYIVDLLPSVSLTTKTLLEVGRRHHELFRSYPSPEEYISYFEEDSIPTTLEMVASEFSEDERKIIEDELSERVRDHKSHQPDDNAPLQVEHYLRFKMMQNDYRSWVSDPDALSKVISMYEDGKIVPVLGDLTGSEAMPAIAESLSKRGIPLSLIYLSNAPYYISKFDRGDNFERNLDSMPVTDKTVIIETSFGGLPLPDSVTSDPWMNKIMQTWDYQVQTVGDLEKQKRGEYKARINGQQYDMYDISDRAYAVSEGASQQEMGILMPKDGLLIAGIKSQIAQ